MSTNKKNLLIGGITRRHLMQISGGAALSTLAAPAVLRAASKLEGELIVETFGGVYTDAVREYVVKPFEERYGIKVKLSGFGSSSEQLAKLLAGNDRVDVSALNSGRMLTAAKGGAVQAINTDNLKHFGGQHINFRKPKYELDDGNNYSVAFIWGDRALVHNTERVSDVPDSWNALFDPRYKGRVAVNGSGVALIYTGAIMTGQKIDDITDLAAVEAKINELKPNLLKFWSSGSEMTQLMATGEVWIGDFWRGRVNKLRDDGVPVQYTVPKEGGIAWVDTLTIPKTCGNLAAAEAFIDMSLDPVVQRNFVTKGVTYAPSNQNTILSAEEKIHLGATEEIFNSAAFPDAAYQAAHIDEWNVIVNRIKSS